MKGLKIAALKDAIDRYNLLPQDVRARVEARVRGDAVDDPLDNVEGEHEMGEKLTRKCDILIVALYTKACCSWESYLGRYVEG